jgi:PTS system galactitol-specific IIC component
MGSAGFLQLLSRVFNTFGASIFVPVILFFVDWIVGTGVKRAFISALYAGIGLMGFMWVAGAFIPIIAPVVQHMVAITGIHLPIVDIGWQATSVIAYATKAGMLYLGVGLLFQTVLYLIHWTNVFQPSDLWNNYSYMAWGSMIYIAMGGDLWFSLLLMLILNLYSLLFSEWLSKRWSTYYGYPNCTIIQLHHVGEVPYAVLMNWLLDKLGANKIKWSPQDLKRRWGFIGDPIILGVIIGALIGFLGNLDKLGTLEGWASILTIAVSLAAVMAIFPRIAAIFADAFTAPTEAFRKLATSKSKAVTRYADTYLGINDATGYGEPATIMTGTILIPIMILVAIILPGNRVLPLIDLIALPYMVEPIIAIMNGNIFKSTIAGIIWFSMGLYVATAVAPLFTKVYSQFATAPLPTGELVTSFGILTKPIMGSIFLAALHWKWIGIGIALVVYFILYFWFKKQKKQIQDYMEKVVE